MFTTKINESVFFIKEGQYLILWCDGNFITYNLFDIYSYVVCLTLTKQLSCTVATLNPTLDPGML